MGPTSTVGPYGAQPCRRAPREGARTGRAWCMVHARARQWQLPRRRRRRAGRRATGSARRSKLPPAVCCSRRARRGNGAVLRREAGGRSHNQLTGCGSATNPRGAGPAARDPAAGHALVHLAACGRGGGGIWGLCACAGRWAQRDAAARADDGGARRATAPRRPQPPTPRAPHPRTDAHGRRGRTLSSVGVAHPGPMRASGGWVGWAGRRGAGACDLARARARRGRQLLWQGGRRGLRWRLLRCVAMVVACIWQSGAGNLAVPAHVRAAVLALE